ncbi:MAG: methyltransferase family protein [Candidatus Kariarchaeaceae archaeon]
MDKEQSNFNKTLEFVYVSILAITYIGLFFTGFFFTNDHIVEIISYAGWGLWGVGFILTMSPNVVLKRRGGVEKGKSYVHTTKLVTDGIYGIIRHPQYTGGIIICLSICLIMQSYFTYGIATIAITITYISMIMEEKKLVEKFGEEYVEYKKKTPRANIIKGIIKKII